MNIEKELGFVILFTEFKFAGLRNTVASIKENFNSPCLCVVPKNSHANDLKTAKAICPLVEGGNTISSMINAGVINSKSPWNLIVMAGNIIKYKPVMRYNRFLESKKDVMYRVVDKGYWRWEDASIHGILMHKDAITEVGNFREEGETLPLCKLMWMANAIEKGYKFKGLVGVKLN